MKKVIIMILILMTYIGMNAAVGNVLITEVFYDTPLNENEQAGSAHMGEYVKITNTGNNSIDITGWQMRCFIIGKTRIDTIKTNTILQPGHSFIWYNCGTNQSFLLQNLFPGIQNASDVILHKHRRFILSNSYAQLSLLDSHGNELDNMYYGNGTNVQQALNGEGKEINLCKSLRRRHNFPDYIGYSLSYIEYVADSVNPFSVDEITVPDGGTPENEPNVGTIIYSGVTGMNYISKAIPRQARNCSGMMAVFGNYNAIISTSYFDGLGRLKQNVTIIDDYTNDVIADYREYDSHGKIKKQWLSTKADADGYSTFIALDELQSSYSSTFPDDNCFYSQNTFDNTVNHRLTETREAGDAWSCHDGKRQVYLVNDGTDSLACISLYINSNGQLVKDGQYPGGELRITKTMDEDNHTVYSFYNKEDSLVLSRCVLDTSKADTYYVYDIYGNLCYVLPPEMSAKLSTYSNGSISGTDANIADYCYIYDYDNRNRCVKKKLPGCEPVYFVYDRNDLLAYSQDGNQRDKGTWTHKAYDNLGRLAYTAVVNDSRTQEQLQESLRHSSPRVAFSGTDGTIFGYTASSENITASSILTVNYYDSYDFISNFASDSLAYRNMNGYDSKYTGPIASQSAKGLLTGTATRVLGDSLMLVKSLYYDCHGNVIQCHESNAVGGYDHDYVHLTFTGKPLTIRHEHSTDTTHHVDINTMTYDAMERLLTTTVTHDGGQVDVITNTYDELGRLASQSCLGGQQTTSYGYNIRNWITSIDAGQGIMKQILHYTDVFDGNTPCFNGNISAMEWSNNAAFSNSCNRYCYSYDGMNRLTNAVYSYHTPGFNNQSIEDYSTSYTYDLNSNITSLRRYGKTEKYSMFGSEYYRYGLMDDLTITRDGNQLKNVTDQCEELTYAGAMDFKDGADTRVEYTWDANGNMTSDLNKGISEIKYNILNLPDKITHSDGHVTYITYAADGRKLNVTYKIDVTGTIIGPITPHGQPGEPSGMTSLIGEDVGLNGMGDGDGRPGIDPPVLHDVERVIMTRDYCGNYIYRNGAIERIMMGNGFLQDSVYYVQIKDYQGNVRAVLDQNHNVVERNDYYPYGGLINASDSQLQPYKYSSKELDRENGLDLYDSEARWYDPILPQTTTQDPLAEKYYPISPYTWCAGNPIEFVDKNGKDYTVEFDFKESEIWIRATYYAVSSDVELAKEGALFWNNLSGEYSMDGMIINFDLSVREVEYDPSKNIYTKESALGRAVYSDGNAPTEGMNFFIIDNNYDWDLNNCSGNTSFGNLIKLPDTADFLTVAHEMGHTIGLLHCLDSHGDLSRQNNNGIMSVSKEDRRNNNVHNFEVKTIIASAVRGEPTYDSINDIKAGRGVLLNNKKVDNIKIKNVQNRKR